MNATNVPSGSSRGVERFGAGRLLQPRDHFRQTNEILLHLVEARHHFAGRCHVWQFGSCFEMPQHRGAGKIAEISRAVLRIDRLQQFELFLGDSKTDHPAFGDSFGHSAALPSTFMMGGMSYEYNSRRCGLPRIPPILGDPLPVYRDDVICRVQYQ